MKVALVKTHNQVRLDEIKTPVPSPGEVLLQIDACGVCGSDYLEATAWAHSWKRFGHEIAATVFATGNGVEGFAVGDQVVVALSVACGTCKSCLAGHPRHCSRLIIAEQGGFGDYLLVKDTRLLFKVEPRLPVELAVFTEPVTVVLDAFHLVELKPEDKLVVIGGGFIACIALLIAKILGVIHPLVLSRKSHPLLDACLASTGGDYVSWLAVGEHTVAAPETFAQKLAEHTGRVVAIHTAPAKFMPLYIEKLPYDSCVVNLGLSASDKDNEMPLDASRLIFKRMQIMSAFPVPCLYLAEAVHLLQKNQDLFSLLTPESLPLERLPEVIAAPRKLKRKIMIVSQPSGGLRS
ncbi:MAG TPA: alcohol dehydrogenase catalytic domain-containing protein [Candidatus Omnitrophota bacterium]|nr:alcohol dehydrogenase catalytic domain-containing protein [Candidatus Omnitrophota bacterium]